MAFQRRCRQFLHPSPVDDPCVLLRLIVRQITNTDAHQVSAEGTAGPDAVLTAGPVEALTFAKPSDDLGFTLVGSSESDLGGLFAADVEPDSAAAHAGLAPGDRLLSIGARGVLWSTLKEALFELSTVQPGQQISLMVVRGGPLALRALSEEIVAAGRGENDTTRPRWGRGLELQNEGSSGRIDTIGPLLQRDLKRDAVGSLGAFIAGGCDTRLGAAFVVEPAADVDLQPGDRLLEINGLSCLRWAQAEVLDQLRLGGPAVRVVLQRLGARQWAAVQASANVKASGTTIRPAGLASGRAALSPAAAFALSAASSSVPSVSSANTLGSTATWVPSISTLVPPSSLGPGDQTTSGAAFGAETGQAHASDGAHPAEYELLRERAVREQLQRSMFELEQDAQARQAKLAGLRRELADTHGLLATTTQQLEQARRTIAQDQIALRAAQERDAALSAQMKDVAAKYQHMEDEKSAVLKSLSRTEKELDSLRATHESEGKQQRAHIATLETELKTARSDLEEEMQKREVVHSDKVRDLKAKHEGALARMQSKIDELTAKHEAEIEKLNEAHTEEIDNLTQQLKEKVEQHAEDMKVAQEHINKAARRGSRSKKNKQRGDANEESEASAREGGSASDVSSDEADERIAELTRLRADLRSVRRELETAQQHHQQHQQQHQQHQQQAGTATAMVSAVAGPVAAFGREHTHGSVHAHADDAQSHARSAHGSHAPSQHQLNVSGASAGTASSDDESDAPTRAAWNDAADESESPAVKALEAQVTSLQEQVDALNAQVEEHVQTITQLQDEAGAHAEAAEESAQEIARLTAELQVRVRITCVRVCMHVCMCVCVIHAYTYVYIYIYIYIHTHTHTHTHTVSLCIIDA
jgi:hypothetical protein